MNTVAEEIEPPPIMKSCTGNKWCNVEVKAKDWPVRDKKTEQNNEGSEKADMGLFTLKIPKGYIKKHYDKSLQQLEVKYSDYTLLLIREQAGAYSTKQSLIPDNVIKQGAKYHPIRQYEIAFTETEPDQEPNDKYEKLLYRLAFFTKSLGLKDAVIYRKEDINAYQRRYDMDSQIDEINVYVTRADRPKEKLVIALINGDVKRLQNILATIEKGNDQAKTESKSQ
ncbi:hypothetical protein [Zooshikella harenae]|uniref:Uncharacterized protein n=1 Tax=Zooshikella harenae TaxID=2827238 RepID=A0ABS5ZA68_9GAMM|nr:hypothetical protein [Zooshikella harenae]MBU2710930.1 hypothetical protein [Zooshikella harenae]